MRHLVVQSDLGAGDLSVFFNKQSQTVVVSKYGKTLATGLWNGKSLSIMSNDGILWLDRLSVECALRIEAQP